MRNCSPKPSPNLSKKVLKKYPAPWHLEGPYELDGICWGSNIAIVAANGDCVMSQWGGGGLGLDSDWSHMAEFLVNTINLKEGFRQPARPAVEKKAEKKLVKKA